MKFRNNIKIAFCICLTLSFAVGVFAQSVLNQPNVLPPPNERLIAVHHPDLKQLETDVREQIAAFQKSLAVEARNPAASAAKLAEAYGTMGQIYQAYSFSETAEECYTNAARLAPNDFRWQYLLGKTFDERGKFNEAIVFYRQAGKIRPGYAPVFISLGNDYLELDLLNVAKESFETALKLNAENPAALYGLGRVNYAQGKYAEAAALFEKVIKLVPDASRVNYSLALAYRGLKDTEKAKLYMSKQGAVGVRAMDPIYDNLNELKKGARLRLIRGKQALEAGSFAEAESEFQKVLAAEPDNVTALVNYGVLLVQQKKFPEAARNLEKAVALDPKNVNARYNLAILLSMRKKHQDAVSHLKKILEINPKDDSARFLLAKELRSAGLFRESLNEFVAVYNANPDDEDVLLELVRFLNDNGNYKTAKELLEKSHARFPARGRTAAALAYLLAAAPPADLRDGEKALELAQKVYDATKQIEHGAIVAMARAELGQCEAAAKLAKDLLAQAVKTGNQPLAAKLKTELARYENEVPCAVKN